MKNLVNEDGTPTVEFMALWNANKEEVKAANLFLGKEGGRWVVKPGRATYRVVHGLSTIPRGTYMEAKHAEARRDEYVAAEAATVYWVGKYGMRDHAKALAEARGDESRIRVVAGRDVAAEVRIEVTYDRPRFGMPEEIAARRAKWAEYAEARRLETGRADFRPSRWELNHTPEPREDVEK